MFKYSVKTQFIPFFFLLLSIPLVSIAETITQDTVWKGEINVSEDVVVPEGLTLTILPGTLVNIFPSDRTKSDAEAISYMTEITVRGRLEVEGVIESPVVFHIKEDNAGRWGGIIIDNGSAHIRSCKVQGAETGIYVVNGSLDISDSVLTGNRYAIIAQGNQSVVTIMSTQVTNNDYGIFSLAGAKVGINGVVTEHNVKKDLFLFDDVKGPVIKPAPDKSETESMIAKNLASCGKLNPDIMMEYTLQDKETAKIYGDEVLLGDTVWRGRILVEGLLRVPENSRLLITPGTIIEFSRKDSDGDGIGENGILLQGLLIAKGTKNEPIIFRSAESQRKAGDWDSVNIMNSDGSQNLVEFCQIEDAYRGLHFHFSNIMVSSSVFRNNYIGMQFQESAAEIKGNRIYGNRSGIRGRDSKVTFTGNYVFSNINGISTYRTDLTAKDNTVLNNMIDGFKIRDGIAEAEGNLIACGRSGFMVNDLFYGRLSGNVVANNFESGISLKRVDNIEISGNFISGNGVNGINLLDAGAVINDNFITGNGERGIGIQSFTGNIAGNNISGNGLYAIENESDSDIAALSNWWGVNDPAAAIYDKDDEAQKGRVLYDPAKEASQVFIWPVKNIFADIAWHGIISIKDKVNFFNAALDIAPGTMILFSKNAGMKVSGGRVFARGNKDGKIVFTSAEKENASHGFSLPVGETVGNILWDEILLEHAEGSEFSFCDFKFATWAVHSHFTDLKVTDSRFINNDGGIRFRSGPVEISRSLFKKNHIGIRSYFGNALIRENVILDNEVGIFVREKGSGLIIRKNNIYSNRAYNIKIGDFNTEDVDARENWWGGDDPLSTIFDERREPGIGNVIYEPFLIDPVNLEGKGEHSH